MPITKTINFLPAIFQSEANQKFLNATLDQLVTESNLQPINGYVGRKFAPGFTDISTYIREIDASRANYQLEPSVVYKNPVSSEVEFLSTYPEFINKLNYYGGTTTDPNKLFSSEYYSYNPNINLDTYINFGQYYWVPTGPEAVTVTAGTVPLENTYYVAADTLANVYNVSGYSSISNPEITLARGGVYTFINNQKNNKFWIQTDPGVSGRQINNNNLSSREVLGVTNNGASPGTVTFSVPLKTAQDFYVNMPVVQNVDLATTLTYAEIQGQLLSTFVTNYQGIDGQKNNLNGKYLIFAQYYADDADWTYSSVTVPSSQRYGIWQITITPTGGGDSTISLTYKAAIPVNNKVIVLSGIEFGNTQWYTNSGNRFVEVPMITASLDTLYYQDQSIEGAVGVIKLVDPLANYIDVDTEIVGKVNYISPNGITFTNGLKVKFDNSVTPVKYRNNEYYVDGVGTGITLTLVSDLTVNYPKEQANFDPTLYFDLPAQVALNFSKDELTITTTDVPSQGNISYGVFPNSTNSNYIVEQQIEYKYPYRVGENSQGDHSSISLLVGSIAMTTVGIPIHAPSNGWYVPGASGTTWHYNEPKVQIIGRDQYGGKPNNDGIYFYDDSSFITANAWGNTFNYSGGSYTSPDGHSKIIGWAADGYPIYGPYGYLNPGDAQSPAIKMQSSYIVSAAATPGRPEARTVTLTANAISTNTLTVSSTFGLNPGMKVTTNTGGLAADTYWIINNGLSTAVGSPAYAGGTNQITLNANVTLYANTTITFEFVQGSFIEDYSYVPGIGSLDQYNGRFGVTPEFPNGTYAYFATQDVTNTPTYPYFVGQAYYGSIQLDTNTTLVDPDYIVINRSSRDKNPWSRRNRWFHQDVIKAACDYNGLPFVLNQSYKATRPIIEFNPNLQLFDFGKNGLTPVDLFDTTITQPFIQVEGTTGIYIDGVSLVDQMRIIFAADQDSSTANKIWVVNFIDPDGTDTTASVIHLTPATDANIQTYDTVSVINGVSNAGKSFWYNGSAWIEGQAKTGLNQAPLFDVFDSDGNSLGDRSVYPIANSTLAFNGTKIFSYKTGTGTADPVLGFPLSYKNFNNIGDIQFVNNFDSDTFLYTIDKVDYTKKINIGYLYKNNLDGSTTKLNCWNTVAYDSKQYQNITYIYDGLNNLFTIDVVPEPNTNSQNLLVFVNYQHIPTSQYRIYDLPGNSRDIWINSGLLKDQDRVDIFVYSTQISKLGFYDIPYNLNYNPQNTSLTALTLGDMRNHIGELVLDSLSVQGSYPGGSNLRDVNVTNQGGLILQQSSPVTYSELFISSDTYNFTNSLLFAQQEYTRFKNKFLSLAATGSNIANLPAPTAVDIILKQINSIKNNSFPWYYSDMIPYGDNRLVIKYTVFDPAQTNYEISNIFDITAPNNQAVLVYKNNSQLLYGIDYTFLPTSPGIKFTSSANLQVDDKLIIVEYQNTDGCYVPETPTKLGLYPKFKPEIYTDNTYADNPQFVKGHDGSLTPIYGDFRDALLLELEKRIYNNIKVTYDNTLINIYENKPGKFRTTRYTNVEFNRITGRVFLPWVGFNRLNYNINSVYNVDDSFTYNYGVTADYTGQRLPGSWRACYEYYYDTQRPHTNPWEMLGFSERPDWWLSTYGPAPYTSGNKILWDDLEAGYIAAGPRQGIDPVFARPGLSQYIPVTENGQLRSPFGLLTSESSPNFNSPWLVGQYGPVETAWRNSSEYPFAMQLSCAISQPAQYFSLGINTNKYKYNTTVNQYLVTDTNQRLTPADVDINGYVNVNGTVDRATGYLNWITDFQTSLGIVDKQPLYDFVKAHTVQLAYRMAGFTSKDRLKVLAEQNSPNSTNTSIIIPDEDYDLILNKSTPTSKSVYSAVIVQKTERGWTVSGYDTDNPYFIAIPVTDTGKKQTIKVLNLSVEWYQSYQTFSVNVPYGTEFTTLQQLTNFLAGYQLALQAQGFRFDYFDQDLGQIRNWQLSTKEFLFWAQQGWGVGNIIVLGPFANRIKITNPISTVEGISDSFYGSKIVDQNFKIVGSDKYSVVRDNNVFRLTTDNTSDLIGLAKVNLVQYEHALVFNNVTQFNDLIYNPAQGLRQFRLRLAGFRTGGWTGTLAAQGYMYNSPGVDAWKSDTDYLRGDLVQYKNFYYSAKNDIPGATSFDFKQWLPVNKENIKVGLINNFATNASQSVDYYNTDVVNLENQFDLYSLSLIGYRNRDYLSDLGITDTSQVKFYQGFIKQKGSKNAIDALGNINLPGQQKTSVSIAEEWAFRVGEYGGLEDNKYVELVLDESYTLSNPTSLQVFSNNSVEYSSLFSNPSGVYKTSSIPWSLPIFLNRTDNSTRTDEIQTAGFVNIEDIDYTLFSINNASSLSGNIASLGIGARVWTAIDPEQKWNVYRISGIPGQLVKIINATEGKLNIQTSNAHGLTTNDVIVMPDAYPFTGIYTVEMIISPTNFIITYNGTFYLNTFTSFNYSNNAIYKFVSQKLTYASEIPSLTPVEGYKIGDKVWITNNQNGEWAVYEKSEPWQISSSLPHGLYTSGGNFGYSVEISYDNNFALVGEPGYFSGQGGITNYVLSFDNEFVEDITVSPVAANTVALGHSIDSGKDYIVAGAPDSAGRRGYVFVYTRNFQGSIAQQQILAANISDAVAFGDSVVISDDDQWAYVGAPDGDKVYVYAYRDNIDSYDVTLAANGVATTFSLGFTPASTEILSVRGTSRDYVPYVDFTISGTSIVFASAPVADSIVVRQRDGFVLSDVISGNAGSKFGYSLAHTTDGSQIAIGAPYANVALDSNGNPITKSGAVSLYDRSIEKFVSIANQTLFGGIRPVRAMSKVYVNNVLQTYGTDYTIVATSWVQLATAPTAGSIVTVETDQFNYIQTLVASDAQANSYYGWDVDICSYNCSLFAGAPNYTVGTIWNTGKVYRNLNQARVYGTITGTTQNPTVTSGNSIRLNNFEVQFLQTSLDSVVDAINAASVPGVTAANVDGYLQINSSSTVNASKLSILPGVGSAINQLGLDVFTQTQILENPTKNAYDNFGYTIRIDNTSTMLGVGSPVATTYENTTFDRYKELLSNSQEVFGTPYVTRVRGGLRVSDTTFDAKSTTFTDKVKSGAVWMFNYLPDARENISHPGTFTFIEQLTPNKLNLNLVSGVGFGSAIDIRNYEMLVGASTDSQVEYQSGTVYKFVDTDRLGGWDAIRVQEPTVDLDSITKNYIYSATNQSVLSNLDYIDPVKGKILGIAEQEITYKTDYDPAIYNNVSNNSMVSESTTFYWNDTQVGDVWWDLSTVRYIDYEQGSIKYRTANWGQLFPGSVVNVYEWVESIYPPSQYALNGGTGTPKYTNAYVTLTYVDPSTNVTTVKYYFWVSGKDSVETNTFGRSLPITAIANYIENPKTSGVRYLAAIRDDAVALYNSNDLVTGKDTILHIDYKTKVDTNIIHSEYKLLSESETRPDVIPTNIYNKLVDSVSGTDASGNSVPDPTLPVQQRYGINYRPRQSMFIDKNKAVQEMVIYCNSVFAQNVISQGYDLTTLSEGESIPPADSGYYNAVVNNLDELSYINLVVLPAGYLVLVLNDSSVGNLWTIYVKDRAVVDWTANTLYRRNTLVRYADNVYIVDTEFTSGSTFSSGNLTLYPGENIWTLTRVQSYQTSDYWTYTDWYAPGFNSSVLPNYTVTDFPSMQNRRYKAGDIVKILNNGQGKWVLMQIFPNTSLTIGIQDGTIKLTDNLYDLASYGMSFDTDLFDTRRFDQNPSLELRKILQALHDDIFVDDLSQDFVTLFFVFVYYVLDEQKYVDWVFKTSFINVLHKVRGLNRPALYSRENQEYYRQYIEEVKPYHTTIREYILNYQGVDNFNGYVTDFDVPAIYDNVLKLYRSPSGDFIYDANALKLPQYQDWKSSYQYQIQSIEIVNGGTGYTVAPQVTITGSQIGNDAVARALITNGVISKVEVLYPGSNYITQPVITLTGGNGTGGKLYALLENGTVRKTKTTLVYDRITYGTEVLEWQANTDYTIGQTVTYANVAYVVDRNFTSGNYFVGNDLTEIPASKFNAANDRIQSYYAPALGMTGKNFGLLQSGIDYPGVTVEGPLYTESGGFDVAPFDSSPFDPLSIDEDGTFVISDTLLDTKITSAYTDTSLGLRPEDIIIDGGEYVDTYSSHAPEELVPGRIFDTLDMTVRTFATNAAASAYSTWVSSTGFTVSEVPVIDGGFGYSANTISVDISGTTGTGATVVPVLDSNGTVTSFSILSAGTGYTTIPNVTITGANTSPARATVYLTQSSYDTFAFRIFKSLNTLQITANTSYGDANVNYNFYRVGAAESTTLTTNLSITANTIVVANAAVLSAPNPGAGIPGVVFINGERITYYAKDNGTNTLSQIRRGTAGTGAAEHLANSVVVDGSSSQLVPFTGLTTRPWANTDVVSITTSGEIAILKANTSYVLDHVWYTEGYYPTTLLTETLEANTAANLITTESSIEISTDDAYASPTDGLGLYASSTIQAIFLKQN